MYILRPRAWNLASSSITPERFVLSRRTVLAGAVAQVASMSFPMASVAQSPARHDMTAALKRATRNAKWPADRSVTPEDINTTYNNFFEFGSHKKIHAAAAAIKSRPWMIKVDGLVEKPTEFDIADLIQKMALEERIYRHRCVEAWSMVVPWMGFPLAELVKLARPLSSAKFMRFEAFQDPSIATGQKQAWYPWPYAEALTMAEADNELAFLVVGAYGKELPKSMGAPIRLHLPWKYGFKSIKSIARVTFTEERPKSFWETFQGREYGFWANVNPEVPHARWSQATERVLGTEDRIPTLLFNGYGEWVAHLYKDVVGERLFT